MIPTKSRRFRGQKLPKNIERLYKQTNCRELSIAVTRMDFAKILGKFTKVKIQYEVSTSPKGKASLQQHPPSPKPRLRSNENGMVLIHRNAYNEHPVKEVLAKKSKNNTPKSPSRRVNNILKENNRIKKTPIAPRDKVITNRNRKQLSSHLKQYGLLFSKPTFNNCQEKKLKTTLTDLLPQITKEILPNSEWCIEYFPKNSEPKDDKVYDRIAAELEDIMCNKKSALVTDNTSTENKVDDFPSIMDILNDSTTESNKPSKENNPSEVKSSLESSDVEAMLLGKPNADSKNEEPMEVDSNDNPVISTFDLGQTKPLQDIHKVEDSSKIIDSEMENPHSPSILDDALQQGIEEHIPVYSAADKADCKETKEVSDTKTEQQDKAPILKSEKVTHVLFKCTKNNTCLKSVMCPKNLKYSIELNSKTVEFLGAPKFIETLEDLKVLLQIVNESEINSLHVLH